MATIDPLQIEPFEICSIRPPTENYSLTFRLTRNCYWNKCAFCPVYKFGARFSRRSLEDVTEDIRRAKLIDDFLTQEAIGIPHHSGGDYDRVRHLAEQIHDVKDSSGHAADVEWLPADPDKDMDPRLAWFQTWFRETPTIEDSMGHLLMWRMAGGETCFLGDSDGLILKQDFLSTVIERVKLSFPTISRFTVYGRTKSAAHLKSFDELRSFRRAGLHRIHFGLESGSNKVLDMVAKGETKSDHIEGCLKTKEAGLSCSIYVMPGLGGKGLSEEHAHETARVISKIGPDFIRLRTLEIFPETPLAEASRKGAFVECDEEDVVKELKIMLEEIDTHTEILSDSASNLLELFGRLPQDREKLLKIVNRYLGLPKREKLVFSLNSRLRSFMGQYGSLPDDLVQALTPFVKDHDLDTSQARDEDLERIIRLIRGKLMP